MKTTTALLCLLLAVPSFAAKSDKDAVERLEVQFRDIHSQARSERFWGGGALLTLGAAGIVTAVVTSGSSNSNLAQNGPILFGVLGGAMTLGGALVLLVPRAAETDSGQFLEMTGSGSDFLKKKRLIGEAKLEKLSSDAHTERLLSGASSIVAGAGSFVWYFATNPLLRGDIFIYTGAILVGTGIAQLIFERPLEGEFRRYRDWTQVAYQKPALDIEWGVAPLVDGAQGVFAVKF